MKNSQINFKSQIIKIFKKMGWFDWMFNVLSFFGLYYKEAKILFLGLDNAGKTSLLNMLKTDTFQAHTPTFHPNADDLIVGNVQFQAHDLGGHLAARKLWKDYFPTIDGIVFLVDAYDRERFAEARTELQSLLREDMLQHVPFLILGNKIDIPTSASEHELRAGLGLHNTTGKDRTTSDALGDVRPVELFMCSIVKKIGYGDGFKWLSAVSNNK